MKFTLQNKQVAVIDDFLSPQEAGEVWNYMCAETYSQVTAANWSGQWRLDDGAVMRGPGTSYGAFEGAQYLYPSKTGIDLLIKAMAAEANRLESWIGKKDKDWGIFTAAPTIYPRGSSLYWHRDAANWMGSYTYYAHPEWNIQWGGELLIADESTQNIPEEMSVFMKSKKPLYGSPKDYSYGAHFDNREANDFILEKGFGTYIMPKPNRLVIIAGNNPHCVSKVDDAAGDHVRASISGFFLKVNRVLP